MGNHTSRHTFLKKTLFKNDPKTFTFYRNPALIYIMDDNTATTKKINIFLAFAEIRTSPADVDGKSLVMRKGIVMKNTETEHIEWHESKDIAKAGYHFMNPCPVYHKSFGTVFLFFKCVKVNEQKQTESHHKRTQLCYITSEDEGENWSGITDLTEKVIGDDIKNWATFGVGPGHGIQTKIGRLIIPAYVYYNDGCSVIPHAFAFYSDNCGDYRSDCSSHDPYDFDFYSDYRGQNWDIGRRVSVESTECEMAEFTSNGKSYIYCNTRNPHHCSSDCCLGTRVEAWSENGGTDFDTILYSEKLVESQMYKGCQGSVVSFTHGEKETWLLYSHPTDRKKRKNLGVYVNKSLLNTSGWNEPRIINPGLSGYSDLAHCGDGLFACLLERGTRELEEIAFVEFSLSDVIKKQ